MKESNTLVGIVAYNSFRREILLKTKGQYMHDGVNYPCGQCGLQFSQMRNLARHKRMKDVMTLIDIIGKKIAFMFIRNKKGENKLS